MDNMRMSAELEEQLETVIRNQKFGAIVRCADLPITYSMIYAELYEGTRIFAVRKKVDQLDQVSVSWKR